LQIRVIVPPHMWSNSGESREPALARSRGGLAWVAHQQLILRRFRLPEGFRVGAGGSEVQAAFVTTSATICGNHDHWAFDSIRAVCNPELGTRINHVGAAASELEFYPRRGQRAIMQFLPPLTVENCLFHYH